MKQQWIVQREGREHPDGQARWDRAYQLILEIARSLEESRMPVKLEVPYASSDLCESVDSASSSNTNH
jgi:hypothetical protein